MTNRNYLIENIRFRVQKTYVLGEHELNRAFGILESLSDEDLETIYGFCEEIWYNGCFEGETEEQSRAARFP